MTGPNTGDHRQIAHHDPLARLLPARRGDESLYAYLDRLSGFQEALCVVLDDPGVNVEELHGVCFDRSVSILAAEVAALPRNPHPPAGTPRLHVVRPTETPTDAHSQPAD